MGAFGGATAKRHRLWSNDKWLLEQIVSQGHLIVSFWSRISRTHMFLQKHLSSFVLFPLGILPGGHMSRAAMQSLPGTALGLVRKYIDKSGKKRMVGVPERLKSSQPLVLILDIKILILIQKTRKWKNISIQNERGHTHQLLGNSWLGWLPQSCRWGPCFTITILQSPTSQSSRNQLQNILWNQDPLPPPREELWVDTAAGDAELFIKHLCPLGHASVSALGDLWPDVSRHMYGFFFPLKQLGFAAVV